MESDAIELRKLRIAVMLSSAIRWALDRPSIGSVLCDPKTRQQLDEDREYEEKKCATQK